MVTLKLSTNNSLTYLERECFLQYCIVKWLCSFKPPVSDGTCKLQIVLTPGQTTTVTFQ